MATEKILIVDDEPEVLDVCKRILEGKGYEIKTAHDGYQAIYLAQTERFDLLLTDIKMPGITGLDIARTIKNSDPSAICVIMTGFSTMDMVIEALKLDIDEFVMKPFTPDELSLAVGKALEKQRLRRENFRLHSLVPLFELNKTLMGTVEVNELLERLLEIAKKETGADFALLYTFEEQQIIAHPQISKTDCPHFQQNICIKLAQYLLKNGQQLLLSGKKASEQDLALLKQLEAQSILATPLKSKEANLGALILVRKTSDFPPSDNEFLSVLCGQASIALENARLFTKIQEAYKKLKKLDHMKSEFINIAAHELRTPLTILMGYATILEDVISPNEREYVSPILRNAMRLRALIDDMLNLQYLESGIPNLAKQELFLKEALEEIIKDIRLLAKEKDLTITVDIPDDFPTMIADRAKLDLIFVNLFNNAVEFTPAGGQITFQARFNTSHATMSVSDTGIGVAKEQLELIFDRFYQVESSLTREHGGIGLGLAIVRGMVEVCGGEIHVNSEEGKGSTFTFTLPLDNRNVEKRQLRI